MKKVLFTAIIMAGVMHVKAQQTLSFNSLSYKISSLKPDTVGKPGFDVFPQVKVPQNNRVKHVIVNGSSNIDRMPIVKPNGNSNMPVVQTDATAYTMPVAGKSLPRIYTMKKLDVILSAPINKK